eukprot:c17788_g1_i1.p1 GENE.c17788_g1_i1~~c17788_g1_i1.p1  ORF type:complete len:285 (+),score=80.71 c17788_g1_i1:43-897(+)
MSDLTTARSSSKRSRDAETKAPSISKKRRIPTAVLPHLPGYFRIKTASGFEYLSVGKSEVETDISDDENDHISSQQPLSDDFSEKLRFSRSPPSGIEAVFWVQNHLDLSRTANTSLQYLSIKSVHTDLYLGLVKDNIIIPTFHPIFAANDSLDIIFHVHTPTASSNSIDSIEDILHPAAGEDGPPEVASRIHSQDFESIIPPFVISTGTKFLCRAKENCVGVCDSLALGEIFLFEHVPEEEVDQLKEQAKNPVETAIPSTEDSQPKEESIEERPALPRSMCSIM